MEVNQKIIAVLKALGYTPEILADSIGIPIRRANMMFKGTASPVCNDFGKICSLVKISPNTFFEMKAAE